MTEKSLECERCSAEFDIQHGMDANRYKITICPFCGENLEDDVFDALSYDDDDSGMGID